MGIFGRLKRGAGRVAEYKEKLEKWQDERAIKEVGREKIATAKYEAQAKTIRARANLEEAKNRFSKARGSGFGFGFGGANLPKPQGNMGMVQMDFGTQPQPQKVKYVYVKKPKTRKVRRVRVRRAIKQAPQPKGIRGLDYM